MHRKRFVFAGSGDLNGKQICEDQKYICIWILFTCIWNGTHLCVHWQTQVWILLRIMKYKCESFCVNVCIMRLFWAHTKMSFPWPRRVQSTFVNMSYSVSRPETRAVGPKLVISLSIMSGAAPKTINARLILWMFCDVMVSFCKNPMSFIPL